MRKRCMKCISMVVLFSFIVSLFPVGAFASIENENNVSTLNASLSNLTWPGFEKFPDIRTDKSKNPASVFMTPVSYKSEFNTKTIDGHTLATSNKYSRNGNYDYLPLYNCTISNAPSITYADDGYMGLYSVLTLNNVKDLNILEPSGSGRSCLVLEGSKPDYINLINGNIFGFKAGTKKENGTTLASDTPALFQSNKEINLWNTEHKNYHSTGFSAGVKFSAPNINEYISDSGISLANTVYNTNSYRLFLDSGGVIKGLNDCTITGNKTIYFLSSDSLGTGKIYGDLTGWNLDFSYGSNIGIETFANATNLKLGNDSNTLDLSGVTSINNFAFRGQPHKTINFGNSLEKISTYAFQGMNNVETIIIPNDVENIGSGVFRGFTKLKNVQISNLSKISNYMFENSGLTEILIPNSVSAIGDGAFMDCRQLFSINLAEGITNIPSEFVKGCISLTNINIPNSVTTLGSQAFNGTGIKSLVLPDSVTTLAVGAFNDADNLESISGGSMIEIPRLAYYDANNLKTVNMPNTVTILGEQAFNKCNSLTNIHLSTSLKTVGTSAFEGCTSLTSLTIPNGVTTIGVNAFKNCTGLTELIIPKSVTVFEGNPFVGIKCPVSVYENSPAKAYCVANSVPYVIVEEIPPQAVSLSPKNDQTISVGDTLQFAASVRPSNATDKTVLWDSSDSSVGTITQDGLFTAIKEGEAYVSVTTNTGSKYAEVCITVENGKKELESITVEGMKDEYDVLSDFVTQGTVIKHYSDGSTKNVPLTGSMVSGFNSKLAGTNSLTISLDGKTCTFPVSISTENIVAVQQDNSENNPNHVKKVYKLNENISQEGKIAVIFKGGITKYADFKDCIVTGFDSSIYHVSSYNECKMQLYGKTGSYYYAVGTPKRMVAGSNNVAYAKGQDKFFNDVSFDLEIQETYNSLNSAYIMKPDKLPGFSTANASEERKVLNVNILGYNCDWFFYVYEVDHLEYLNMKPSYDINDGLYSDWSAMRVEPHYKYSCSSTARPTLAELEANGMLTGWDTSTPGVKTINIDYFGFKDSFQINVVDASKEVESISVEDYNPLYSLNQSFVEQGNVLVNYVDGTKAKIPLKSSMISGFDTSSNGWFRLTVTYQDKTTTFNYLVGTYKTITANETGRTIWAKDEPYPEYITCYIYIKETSDRIYYNVPIDKVTGFTLETITGIGNQRLATVYVLGKQPTFWYEVKEVDNISVINLDSDVYVGTEFPGKSRFGIEFVDGTTTSRTFDSYPWLISGWDTSTPGNKTLTINFSGKTYQFNYTVHDPNEKLVKSVELLTKSKTFYQTEELSNDIKAKVIYNDDSEEEVIVQQSNLDSFSTDTPGTFSSNVTIGGKSDTFNYTVIEVTSIEFPTDGYSDGPADPAFKDMVLLSPQFTYLPGDSFNEDGFIRVNLADGTSFFKQLTKDMITDFDTNQSDNFQGRFYVNFAGKQTYHGYFVSNETTLEWKFYQPVHDIYQIGEEFKEGNIFNTINWGGWGYPAQALRLFMIPDFDTSEPGEYAIPIKFLGKENLMYEYTVKDKDVSSIEIVSAKDSYLLNEDFDANAKLKINYADGSSKEIALTESMLDSFDTSSKGDKKSIITYNDVALEYNYSVKAAVSSIELISDKVSYFINEPFDSNAKLKVTYSDGEVQEMAITEEALTGFSTSTAGNKTLTVTYEGKTTTFDYTVSKVVEESITIEGVTASYPVNGTFDGYGKVIIHYTDGSTKEIPLLESYLSGFNTSTSGKRLVTVTYNGMNAQYEITVTKVLDSIEVSGTKLEYEVNEKFTAQGSLTLHYKDGSRDTIDLDESMVSNFDTSTLGSFTATVTYDGKTATIEYNVISNVKLDSISVEDVTTNYTIGAPFDGRGKIIAHYSDGSTKEAVLLESNLTGFNTSVAGTRLVTVSYEGLTTQFEIEVVKQVDRITVSDMETEYAINSEFVKQGNVTVYYKDGSQDTISLDESMVSNFDTSTAGKHTVTVTYAGKTTTYKINVGESTPVSITANWDGKKTIQVDATGKFSHITLPNGNSFYKPSFIWPVLSSGVYDFTIHGQDGTSVDSDMVVVSDWDVTPPIISFSSTYKTNDPVTVTVIDPESGFDRCIAPDGTEYATSTFAYTPGMYGTFVAYDKAGNMAAKDFNVLDVQIGGGSSTTYVALDGIPNAWTNQDVVLKVGALNDEEGVISIEANGSNIDNSEVEFSPNEDVIASDEEPIDERTDSPISDEESNGNQEDTTVSGSKTENKDDIEDEVDKDLTGSDIESKPESDIESEEEVVEPDQNTTEEEIALDSDEGESVLTAISTLTRYLVDGPMLLDAISKSPVVNTLTVVDNGPISFTVITPSGEYEDSVVVERIDKVAPELTLTLRENNVLSVVATDDLSGLKYIDIEGINSYNFNTDGILISGFDVFVPANGTITVAATDYAGNITTQTVDITYDTSNPPEEPNITPVDPSNPPNGDESGNSGNGDDTPGGDDENGGTPPGPDDVTPPDNDSSDDINGNNGSSSGGGGGTSSNTGTSPDNVNKGESASDIGGIDKDNKPYVLHAGIKINGTVGKGYISGYEDRTFRPTNNLTRQEFASIIDRIITFETEANEPPTPFTDTQGCWGESNINHLAQHNLIAGVEGNKFEPNRNITRAEAVVILSRIVDFSEYPSTSKLQGLSEWQQKSMIAQALNAGLVSNYDEETYDVNKNITRAEVVNVINNIVFSNKLSNKRNIFTDVSDRDSWYEDVVKATDEKMLEMYK